MHEVSRSTACDGCLGSRQCWVCLGQGDIERSRGQREPCDRCAATGICPDCAPVTLSRVITLPQDSAELVQVADEVG